LVVDEGQHSKNKVDSFRHTLREPGRKGEDCIRADFSAILKFIECSIYGHATPLGTYVDSFIQCRTSASTVFYNAPMVPIRGHYYLDMNATHALLRFIRGVYSSTLVLQNYEACIHNVLY
jgi:hypothetical protein